MCRRFAGQAIHFAEYKHNPAGVFPSAGLVRLENSDPSQDPTRPAEENRQQSKESPAATRVFSLFDSGSAAAEFDSDQVSMMKKKKVTYAEKRVYKPSGTTAHVD